MKCVLLRFDAPLVSFGATAIDQHGVVQRFPALSMLVGIVANALGWDHREWQRLDALQDRVRFAARIDRAGEPLVDYQTVDLAAEWMRPELAGWTTRGRVAWRGGDSKNATGTHQRYRHYRADSIHTVALTLEGEATPTVEQLAAAIRKPVRPLFIGRKCCLPATPLLLALVEAPTLVAALAAVPRLARGDAGPLPACWSEGEDGGTGESHLVPVTDERDWRSRVHVGRRLVREGFVNPPEVPSA